MRPDIAVPNCTEQCIGEGMQSDIRVAVPHKPLGVRNADATKHDRVARPKRMNVVPGPNADHARPI